MNRKFLECLYQGVGITLGYLLILNLCRVIYELGYNEGRVKNVIGKVRNDGKVAHYPFPNESDYDDPVKASDNDSENHPVS